jgi:hypothetical protein
MQFQDGIDAVPGLLFVDDLAISSFVVKDLWKSNEQVVKYGDKETE